MGEPLSVFLVTFISSKWKMMLQYHQYHMLSKILDKIYSIQKLGDNFLFNQINNYHSNIKFTIELNPSGSFQTPNFPTSKVSVNSTFEKAQNYLHHVSPKLQIVINEINLMTIFIVQIQFDQTLTKKSF